MNIGERIKYYRLGRNMTQEKLAGKLHIKRQTLSAYETGHALPNIYVLCSIADVLDISLDELVGRQEEKERDKKTEKKRCCL